MERERLAHLSAIHHTHAPSLKPMPNKTDKRSVLVNLLSKPICTQEDTAQVIQEMGHLIISVSLDVEEVKSILKNKKTMIPWRWVVSSFCFPFLVAGAAWFFFDFMPKAMAVIFKP
jgi:hypothetical protein